MAVLLSEPRAESCKRALERDSKLVISASTMAEALIVAARRGLGSEMAQILEDLDFEVATTTGASARRAARAYDLWGKGMHPSHLNFGDCFAYALAMERGCPLLFVGDDFSLTDVQSALSSSEG
jgi:ribonuclease VapC